MNDEEIHDIQTKYEKLSRDVRLALANDPSRSQIEDIFKPLYELRHTIYTLLVGTMLTDSQRRSLYDVRAALDKLIASQTLPFRSSESASNSNMQDELKLANFIEISINSIDEAVQHADYIASSLTRQNGILQRTRNLSKLLGYTLRANARVLNKIRQTHFKQTVILGLVTFVCVFIFIRQFFVRY